jgi:hypothetical protein
VNRAPGRPGLQRELRHERLPASRLTKRLSPVLLVLYSQAAQGLALLGIVLAVRQSFAAVGLAWGAAAGALIAIGLVTYYRALAKGRPGCEGCIEFPTGPHPQGHMRQPRSEACVQTGRRASHGSGSLAQPRYEHEQNHVVSRA